jgi:uncharacterized membrane protein YdjX (TVP38/TMEM64 family)
MEAPPVRVTPVASWSRRRLALWIFVGMAVLVLGHAVDAPSRLPRALAAVAGLGAWGLAIFVLLYVATTVAVLPAVVLTLGAGAVFGVVRGFVLVSIGATLGATLAFLIGRHLAREAVMKRLAGNATVVAIDTAVARDGWKIVLLTRLSPLFPFVFLNYMFGLTRVPLGEYVVASAIGMMPAIALYTYLGSLAGDVAAAAAGARTRSPWEWALYAVGLVATLAVALYVTRVARRALDRRIAS